MEGFRCCVELPPFVEGRYCERQTCSQQADHTKRRQNHWQLCDNWTPSEPLQIQIAQRKERIEKTTSQLTPAFAARAALRQRLQTDLVQRQLRVEQAVAEFAPGLAVLAQTVPCRRAGNRIIVVVHCLDKPALNKFENQ